MRTGLFWDAEEGAYWFFDIQADGKTCAYRADRRADIPLFCGPWRKADLGARVLFPLSENLEGFGMYAVQDDRLWYELTVQLQRATFPRASRCIGMSTAGGGLL